MTSKIARRTTTTTPAVIANTPDLDAEIAADAANETANPDVLARITTAAQEMRKLQKEAEHFTGLAAERETEARRLSEQVLPPLMDEAGVTDLGLDDDTRVERMEKVYASIAKDNEAAAAQWLEKHGYGDIIKSSVVIPVDKGDIKTLTRLRSSLTKAGIAFEERSGVHPATLVAFVKESLTMNPPRDLPKAIMHHTQAVVVLKAQKKRAQKSRKGALV